MINSSHRGGRTAEAMAFQGVCILGLVSLCMLQLLAGAHAAAFLQEQLPLKVLVTTPTAIATHTTDAAAVTVQGRQAITAVFSRPVIALGSDWGTKELPSNLVPFNLTCGMPGRLRWVTTNIARFDPVVDWPTDLACDFQWNTALKSFDGAPLVLDGLSASVPLATQPLSMQLISVTSEAANNATDNLWDAKPGLPGENFPEIPPDASITLSFSYPVELSKLASVLKVAGPGAGSRTVTVSPCAYAEPIFRPLVFTAAGVKPETAPSAYSGVSMEALMQLNSTCAVVKITPALGPGAEAVLRLPKGTRYSAIAGPVGSDTDLPVFGLRAFRIPLQLDFQNITNMSQTVYNGVRYRRVTMWLPHGLATGTQLSALKPLIKICSFSEPFNGGSACVDQALELSRPTKGTLVASIPELAPKLRYKVTVQADANVKDAFGLPLQASANTWWTVELETAFQGPNMNQIALLEVQPEGQALQWPWVCRGKPEAGLDKVQAWDIAVPSSDANAKNSNMARVVAAMSYGNSGIKSDALGNPDASITRNTSPAPTFQPLALSGKAGLSFVGSCCRDVSWPTARKVFTNELLVVQSNLQAAFVAAGNSVVAWVTTTQGASKAVQGAKVQVYLSNYGQDFAALGPSCTTTAEGLCTLNVSSNDGAVKSALITAPNEGPLVMPRLPSTYVNMGSKYSGAIVLDRQLVKPGDELHVTAYIQQRNGTKLQLAQGLKSVILEISPSFDASSPTGSTRLTVPVNTSFGSVHVNLTVPNNATPANYYLQLFTITKTPSNSNAPLVAPLANIMRPTALAASSESASNAEVPVVSADAGPTLAPVPEQGSIAVDGVVPPVLPPVPIIQPGDFIALAGFTVGDPRPPTATLEITAPAWVRPNGTMQVVLQAKSYIGSDVSDAEMTLEWETSLARGNVTLTTNSEGNATGSINLSELPAANISEPGDELRLSVNWVGPTREVISASKTVKIADGPFRVELQRTLLTDVPGIKFGIRADAFSNEDDSPVKGKSVEVSLAAANGTASLTNCSAAQLAALAQQKCTITSGEPRAAAWCQLALPCMGKFELRGCVEGSCGKPISIGRNASWWEASPWSSAPQLNLLADRENVTIGGALNITVQNLWWGPTSGLLVWGNAVKREVRFLPQIPPGPSTIAINNIGEECRDSCGFSLTLAVARNTTPAATASATQMTRFIGSRNLPFGFNIQIRIPVFDRDAQATGPGAVQASQSTAQLASTDAAAGRNLGLFPSSSATGSSSSSSWNANTASAALAASGLPDIPTSALFDPLVPRTVSAELTVQGPKTEPLNVTVTVEGQSKTSDGVAVIAPKSGKGSIKVAVKDASGKPVPDAEVTVLVVDKAILDLMPYPLQDVSSAVVADLAATFDLFDLNSFRTSRAAINATFTALQRRLLKLDPWLPVDTQVTPGGGYYYGGDVPPAAAAVDVPDAKYLAGYATAITPMPYRPCIIGQFCQMYESRGVMKTLMPAEADGAVAMAALAAPAPAPAMSPVAAPLMAKTAASAAANNMAPAANFTAVAGGAGSAQGGNGLRIQQEFKVTPLFTVIKSTADGSAVATFTAPDNLGTFVVRAYAAAKKPSGSADPVDVVYGAGKSEVIVRRTVSLTPSLPRQVRTGDNFTAGVLVDSPGVTSDIKVTVTASLVEPKGDGTPGNPLALNDPKSVTVTLTPGDTQQEARFNFRARGLGLQNITFTAAAADSSSSGDVADQVQLEVPVNGKQGPVWIATSFAVRGSNSSTVANRVEGMSLPKADNGSGSVSLVAGVGYLPAIQGTYEGLVRMGLTAFQDCPSGANAIALSVLPAMLAAYRPVSTPPSSYLTPFQKNTSQQAMKQAYGPLTDATYGLMSVEPRCLWLFSSGPDRADISLNAWATWLVNQLSNVPASSGTVGFTTSAGFAAGWGSLKEAIKTWRNALESQLIADAVAARARTPPRAYSDMDTLSWARLVLGENWTASGVSSEVQQDLSMERLVAAAVNMSVGMQARVGLTLLDSGNSRKPAVDKIVSRLLSNVRVGGLTAYVATGDGERGAAPLSDQSLAVLLFQRSKTDNPLIQKVVAWVGQGAAPPPMPFGALCISSNPWESALRSRALSYYDESTSSATPDVILTAVAALPVAASSSSNGSTAPKHFKDNAVPLLSSRFNSSNAGEVPRSSTKWDKIPVGSSLVFTAKGTGEISVAASLNFTPEQLLPFATYRGLWVQRVVQLAEAEGRSLKAVGLGRLVTMAVQVTSPDDQSNVIVEVLMPGGLEPLDPNVYKDADLATICSSSEDESDLTAGGSSGFGNGGISGRKVSGGAAYPMMSTVAIPSVSISYAGSSNSGPSSGGLSPYQAAVRWWSPWPVCPVQTTSPASVLFSFTYFRAGTQTIRFKAVAATSGVFALPPVKAYVQQQPEVMGLSPAGVFTVCPTAADCPAAQQLLQADAAAKPCPKDCNGNGACNLASGTCICDAGFSGQDCGTFSSSR